MKIVIDFDNDKIRIVNELDEEIAAFPRPRTMTEVLTLLQEVINWIPLPDHDDSLNVKLHEQVNGQINIID